MRRECRRQSAGSEGTSGTRSGRDSSAFLIDTYGMDSIEKLWSVGEASGSDPGEIYEHYEVVLGRLTLEDLESQWLQSIGVSP